MFLDGLENGYHGLGTIPQAGHGFVNKLEIDFFHLFPPGPRIPRRLGAGIPGLFHFRPVRQGFLLSVTSSKAK